MGNGRRDHAGVNESSFRNDIYIKCRVPELYDVHLIRSSKHCVAERSLDWSCVDRRSGQRCGILLTLLARYRRVSRKKTRRFSPGENKLVAYWREVKCGGRVERRGNTAKYVWCLSSSSGTCSSACIAANDTLRFAPPRAAYKTTIFLSAVVLTGSR